MLMSGTGNHEAGLGSQIARPEYAGLRGYERYIPKRIATLPEVLSADGYHTYMSGKWHLASGDPSDDSLAGNRGFERSFAMILGGEGHIETVGTTHIYSEDGKRLDESPQNFHSTNLFLDKLLGFMRADEDDDKPFFAWFAPTAPHWPLQPHPDWIDRFAGNYDEGFDELCMDRLAGAADAGTLPANARTDGCHKSELPWDELTEEKRQMYRRTMELHAAMVAHLDYEFQRLIGYLDETGQLDNTYIIFMNDNGPQGGGFESRPPDDQRDNSLENLGKNATSAPYSYSKAVQYEGGIRVPAFVWHSDITNKGTVNNQLLTVMDIMPTILGLAGTEHPAPSFEGREVLPMRGRSFGSIIEGSDERIHPLDEDIALASAGRNVMFRGPWKIVKELHNDPGERNDLSSSMPDLREEMIRSFDVQAEERNYLDRVPAAN
jgi:arylsulfatase